MVAVNAKDSTQAAFGTITPPRFGQLETAAGLPLYEAVKRHMSEAILVGEWPPGTILPNEVELARLYGIAVGTVRRAMGDLVAEGLLARRRKTGTIVTGRTPHHSLRFFFQFFRLHGADGSQVRSVARMLSREIGAADSVEAQGLGLSSEEPVLRLQRLRSIGGTPVMHDRLVLPASRVPDFPERLDDVPALLYIHLVERYGIRVSAVREELTAELATAEDLTLLCLAPPAPVLAIREIAYDQAGDPVIFASHRASTHAHRYLNEIR